MLYFTVLPNLAVTKSLHDLKYVCNKLNAFKSLLQ